MNRSRADNRSQLIRTVAALKRPEPPPPRLAEGFGVPRSRLSRIMRCETPAQRNTYTRILSACKMSVKAPFLMDSLCIRASETLRKI